MRYLKYFLLILLYLCLSSQLVMAAHPHCNIISWGSITSSSTVPAVPADYRSGGNYEFLNAFQFTPIINAVPPPSGHSNCVYELTDITQIDITFTFTGTMTWDKINFGGVIVDPVEPISFVSGVAVSYQFEPHQSNTAVPGPIEGINPYNGTFPITFFGDNNGFNITAASISLRGNHYYIPEPNTVFLLGTGLALLAGARRKMLA
jgi:hypothetical protein